MNQQASLNVDYTENSFVLINTNKEVIFFKVDQTQEIEIYLPHQPIIGKPVLDCISISYKHDFNEVLDRALAGESITFRDEMTHRLTERPFVIIITCTPIYIAGELTYINCTFATMKRVTNIVRKFDDYSKFASHELRPPITNILSLSNLRNYPKMKTYDVDRIRFLLNDIYEQAEKLDNVIMVLNGLINDNEENNQQQEIPTQLQKVSSGIVNRHIVLVDDEPIVNRLHQMLLKKYQQDRTIIDFADPALAMEYVINNKPDLIFLDLNMPKINGWEFLKLIEDNRIKVSVIIVSSSIDEHEKAKAKAYPFVKDFLSKPLTSENISAMFS